MNTLTYRKVWQIAWPIILSNITVPLVGVVDTAVIGRLPGPDYIAAVALGAIMFDFIFWGFNFLKITTSGLTSQALGADQYTKAGEHISRAFVIAIAAALVVLLLHQPVLSLMLGIYQPEPSVASATSDYFNIRIWGTPAVFVNYVILGGFIALQKTRYIFLHQLLLNLINIILDLIFVLVLDWQVKGVAIATVIANFTACGAGVVWLRQATGSFNLQLSLGSVLKQNIHHYLCVMKLNTNIMIRTACLVFSFAYLAYMGNKLGTLFLAANAILLHFQAIMAYGLDGFADATESLSGRAYGKRSAAELMRAMRYTTHWAVATALVCTLVYLVFGRHIVALFSIDPSVIQTAREYLPWLIISPLISVWSFQFDGIYAGTTHSVEMRNGMLLSTLLFVALCTLLVPYRHNHGLWLAFVIFMAFRGLILAWWFPRIPRSISV